MLTEMKDDVKVLISITMYSEKMDEFLKTMRGVCEDANFMFQNGILKQEELLVIVISDGLDRLSK